MASSRVFSVSLRSRDLLHVAVRGGTTRLKADATPPPPPPPVRRRMGSELRGRVYVSKELKSLGRGGRGEREEEGGGEKGRRRGEGRKGGGGGRGEREEEGGGEKGRRRREGG